MHTHHPDRFRYEVETHAIAGGGRSWRVLERHSGGRFSVIASGTVLAPRGERCDHEALVSSIRAAESAGMALG
ncbi:hypothetical protein GT347_25905 [Xylophilus rhododendri]|uniref:Uncharacterized protein n=1 Tax=Xylophilus rhododendri TaxID=2697032 RepID=A0A857JBR7_9BURK|nr:hypothetical protein [Xylophilus rhododendri]QHJ01118.1 hypothetical protein GT347_25905 [Xylophilus rhododendri]